MVFIIKAILASMFSWVLNPVREWMREREIRKQVHNEVDKDTAEFVAKVTKETLVEDRNNEQKFHGMDKQKIVELNSRIRDSLKSGRLRNDQGD